MRPLRQLARRLGAHARDRFHTWQERHDYSTHEAALRLAGAVTGLVILVPLAGWLALQLGTILAEFVGWVVSDHPDSAAHPDSASTVEQSLHRAVPALASMVTGALGHWFREHTHGTGLTAGDLGLVWGSVASLITLGALARIRGAQLAYVGIAAAATTWIAWHGAPTGERLVTAGTVAVLCALLGMLAGGRVGTRIHTHVDARPQERSASDLARAQDNSRALTQLSQAVQRMSHSPQAPDPPAAPGYTSSDLEEGAAVAATTGLDRTLLPSEMAALLRTARNWPAPEHTRSMM